MNQKTLGIFLLILGAILVPLGGLALTIGYNERQNAIMTLNGELNPFQINTSTPIDIVIGNHTEDRLYSSQELKNGISLGHLFALESDCYPSNNLTIRFIDNKLYVSGEIKNENNETIPQIVDNNWKTINPESLQFWDRNYNAYAFEIIGNKNIPILQISMIGPNKIQIGAMMYYTKNGPRYVLPLTVKGEQILDNPSDKTLQSIDAPRIFKYPALTNPDNLGKMVNPNYPSSDPLLESTLTLIIGFIMTIAGSIMILFGYERCKEPTKKDGGKKKKRYFKDDY